MNIGSDITVDGTITARQATKEGEAVVLGSDGLIPARLVAGSKKDLYPYPYLLFRDIVVRSLEAETEAPTDSDAKHRYSHTRYLGPSTTTDGGSTVNPPLVGDLPIFAKCIYETALTPKQAYARIVPSSELLDLLAPAIYSNITTSSIRIRLANAQFSSSVYLSLEEGELKTVSGDVRVRSSSPSAVVYVGVYD